MTGPLLTQDIALQLRDAATRGAASTETSLDLGRSRERVEVDATGWRWRGQQYPHLDGARERTIYHFSGAQFEPVARWSGSLIKLVPTHWGPPTFEIDGIKMLPTAQVSPLADAHAKVARIAPRGRTILDTCGGLGYFAVAALEAGAARIVSFEKNADVIWLRELNPWSPREDARVSLAHADIVVQIATLADASFDAALHDPPRFGIAGELYSLQFYLELARVLQPGAPLFHYTGAPNQRSRGRDLPAEVIARLQRAGFDAKRSGDGVLAVRRRR